MTQLILNIEQPSILPSLKKVLSLIDGVSIAQPRKRKTGLQLALEDVKAGRVHKADSIEDLFNQLNAD